MPEGVHVVAPADISDAEAVVRLLPTEGVGALWLDLSRVDRIAPIGVVGLLALVRGAVRHGPTRLSVTTPRDSSVADLLAGAGFFRALDELGAETAGGLTSDRPASDLHIGATLVSTEFEMEKAANELDERLAEARAPVATRHAAYLVMTEVANNAWQHGANCYLMAQTLPGQPGTPRGLHIAVADSGPGFLAGLGQRYRLRSEESAIRMAFEERVSSTGDPYRGFGLWYCIRVVDDYAGARLSFVSQDARIERREGRNVVRAGARCQGVLVSAYFPF